MPTSIEILKGSLEKAKIFFLAASGDTASLAPGKMRKSSGSNLEPFPKTCGRIVRLIGLSAGSMFLP